MEPDRKLFPLPFLLIKKSEVSGDIVLGEGPLNQRSSFRVFFLPVQLVTAFHIRVG